MPRSSLLCAPFLLFALANLLTAQSNWTRFRGPLGTGFAPDADPPVEWSENRNVKWRALLPGLGHSTPVVTADWVLLTAAEPIGEPFDPLPDEAPGSHDNLRVTSRIRFLALGFDRASGKEMWRRTLLEAIPHEGGHVSGSHASASPVTDGERWFAFFGSYGLYALDVRGELLWSRSFGRMATKHGHGEGASPALHGDTLYVPWDHEGDSFLFALDANTGKERFRVARDEPTSWSSPIVVELADEVQVVLAGTNAVRGYDAETGEVLWSCTGLTPNIVATPIFHDGRLYVGSSYGRQAFLALDLEGARGDLTLTDHVVWTRRRRTPYIPSPLLVDGWLYLLHHYQGIVSRVEASTGKEPGEPLRLPGVREVYASPVAAKDRIYITDRSGITVVFQAGPEPRLLAVNSLADTVSASLALVDREIIVRGERTLYCIAEERD